MNNKKRSVEDEHNYDGCNRSMVLTVEKAFGLLLTHNVAIMLLVGPMRGLFHSSAFISLLHLINDFPFRFDYSFNSFIFFFFFSFFSLPFFNIKFSVLLRRNIHHCVENSTLVRFLNFGRAVSQ